MDTSRPTDSEPREDEFLDADDTTASPNANDAADGDGGGDAELALALAERDEAVAARQRALADYANYQRRSVENEARARVGGLVQMVRALLPVLDHFDLALAQDLSKLSVEQLAKSIEMTRAELQKALEQNGISRIEPAAGEAFNPVEHDAVMRHRLFVQQCRSVLQVTRWLAAGRIRTEGHRVVVDGARYDDAACCPALEDPEVIAFEPPAPAPHAPSGPPDRS